MEKLSKGTKPSVKTKGHRSPPAGYPTSRSMYADPVNYKYRLDSEKYTRAALAYLSMPKNQKGYSSAELSYMFDRIYRACRKYGINISDSDRGRKAKAMSIIKLAQVLNALEEYGLEDEANALHDILVSFHKA